MEVQKKNLIIALAMIILLSELSYWHFKKLSKALNKPIEMPKFETPKFEPFAEKEGQKDFVSPDGKLKLTYGANWIEMDFKVLENLTQRSMEEKPLFFAERIKANAQKVAFLTVQEINLGEENKSFEKFIEQMKNDVKEKQGEIEILKSEIREGNMIFEAEYKSSKGILSRSKEKIILDEKIYLVSVITLGKDWGEFEKEAEEIIDSVQIIK